MMCVKAPVDDDPPAPLKMLDHPLRRRWSVPDAFFFSCFGRATSEGQDSRTLLFCTTQR